MTTTYVAYMLYLLYITQRDEAYPVYRTETVTTTAEKHVISFAVFTTVTTVV